MGELCLICGEEKDEKHFRYSKVKCNECCRKKAIERINRIKEKNRKRKLKERERKKKETPKYLQKKLIEKQQREEKRENRRKLEILKAEERQRIYKEKLRIFEESLYPKIKKIKVNRNMKQQLKKRQLIQDKKGIYCKLKVCNICYKYQIEYYFLDNNDNILDICVSCRRLQNEIESNELLEFEKTNFKLEEEYSSYCNICGEIKLASDFKFVNGILNEICNECINKESQIQKYKKLKLNLINKTPKFNYRKYSKSQINSHRMNWGFTPINEFFKYSNAHHLHLENNHSFIIYIPNWLHDFIGHNYIKGYGMDRINAIALDYWINEDVYDWIVKN